MSLPKVALDVVITPRAGQASSVQTFLAGGKDLVDAEPGTLQWFGFRVADQDVFGVFDTFHADAGRTAHIGGDLAKALGSAADELLAAGPQMGFVDVFAHKVSGASAGLKVGLRVILQAKAATADALKHALVARAPGVEREAFTPYWYAFQKEGCVFGLIGVFRTDEDRTAHLGASDTQVLMGKFEDLIDGAPDVTLFDVIAYKA